MLQYANSTANLGCPRSRFWDLGCLGRSHHRSLENQPDHKSRGSQVPASGIIQTSPNSKPRGSCPICSHPAEMSPAIFRTDFECEHCGAPLRISMLYSRTLVILSILIGYSVAWKVGAGSFVVFFWGVTWKFLLLCLPLSYLILTLIVRIAPYLVRPTLTTRQTFESHLTTLNLSNNDPLTDSQTMALDGSHDPTKPNEKTH
jgi:hypothetical protein